MLNWALGFGANRRGQYNRDFRGRGGGCNRVYHEGRDTNNGDQLVEGAGGGAGYFEARGESDASGHEGRRADNQEERGGAVPGQ